jgi:magnesium transporter
VIADVARRVANGPVPDHALAAALSLIDRTIERYDEVVEVLGASQEVHAADIADADRRSTPKEIVSEGLRLATRISEVQRGVRGLRHALVALRPFSARADDVTEAAFDSSWRALDALDADLDILSHRLEVTTDAQLSLLSARQAEINKRIGAWAGVFAVNAVITGWYGMNIRGLPGAGSWVTVAILMAVVSLALIMLLRRIDWL